MNGTQVGVNPRLVRAAGLLVRAVAVKEIAATIPAPLSAQLTLSANQTINAVIDDYCGTPSPPKVRNPWSLPSPVALELAAMVVVFANTRVLSESMRSELVKVAGSLVTKAFATVAP
jgi:hypothetical protein